MTLVFLPGRTYHGEAINPKSLSFFEKYAMRLHKVRKLLYILSFNIADALALGFAC